jgi:hypothetical protein
MPEGPDGKEEDKSSSSRPSFVCGKRKRAFLTMEKRSKFIVDEKGKMKGILLSLKEYKRMEEIIEDLGDTIDFLQAERETTSFIPYEKFRKKWLSK